MFDIAPSEFVLIAAVAILCIGPKDMPRALRTAGHWMGKMRRVSNQLRAGMETMIREAELQEMEQKWREQNEAIMRAHPQENAPLATPLIEHAPPPLPGPAHDPGDPPPLAGGTSPSLPVPPAAAAE